jgi:haloacetate dehalogenase
MSAADDPSGRVAGLTRLRVSTGDAELAVQVGGEGPAVVLLHGYPQTSLMWRHVVPRLLPDHRVVLVDLRGYGASTAPPPAADGSTYAKRTMAADIVAVLDRLDLDEVDVVGHDRGARVAHRLCLDHGDRVRTAAVLDIVPTLHMFDHVDRAMADSYFHWFFLTQPGGLPERLIAADPEAWVRSRFAGRHLPGAEPDVAAVAHYVDAHRRPGRIEAACADYRAAASIDLRHDRSDRDAGRRVAAPLLVGWGTESYVGRSFDVPVVWASYADDVTAAPIEADHYVAEESPEATATALLRFWGQR